MSHIFSVYEGQPFEAYDDQLHKQRYRRLLNIEYQKSKCKLPNLLLKKYTKILETGEFYDTEILVGEAPNNKIFRLHSFVLKVCSPYFRTAFSSNWVKVENNITKFQKPNISVKVFEILVK